MHVVWFKRDLRLVDHAPLTDAVAAGGPVLPLYILEPGLWAQPESAGRQFEFLCESLDALDQALRLRGARLVVKVGEAVDVLAALHQAHGISALHSHEETGLLWTFERDKAVKRWADAAGVVWRETPQFGVVRRLKTRDGWAKRWDAMMAAPIQPAPHAVPMAELPGDPRPDAPALGLPPDPCPERQRGGRDAGLDVLASFFDGRGRTYRKDMSSPLTAFEACSRLSPHLAFGAVSMREAAQAAWAAAAAKRAAGDTAYAASLSSFIGRLHWHCHFMQKLEDEPGVETRCLHPVYEGLRPDPSADDPHLQAWIQGRTGLPFVDACMRAMVMAVSSYHLWRHWRRPAQELARLFTDFEAGIHYPQAQMQSGTTGVNTVRIYNPVKQSRDQDPDGVFIRRWAPEIAALPDAFLHEPWRTPDAVQAETGVRIGETYPMRIVDHEAAARYAREQIYGARRGPAYRAKADAIQDKHGSRKSGVVNRGRVGRRRPRAAPADPAAPQLALDLPPSPSGEGRT